MLAVDCGTLNLVNPPLEFYKNGTITFDLSDSSLSYTKIADTLPAFDLNFIQIITLFMNIIK